MKKYQYKVISLKRSMWTGKAKADYLEVLNKYGRDGWRFKLFADKYAVNKPHKNIELNFQRAIPTTKFRHDI